MKQNCTSLAVIDKTYVDVALSILHGVKIRSSSLSERFPVLIIVFVLFYPGLINS